MSGDLRSMTRESDVPDGSGRSIAIVCSQYNDAIVERLERGARTTLVDHGVDDADIDTYWAPGALEIPQVAQAIAATDRYDAIVALGCVIRGDTYHFEVVCDQSAAGLMRLAMTTDVAITNGILTVYDVEQARVRSGDDDHNKGTEVALAALETLSVIDRVTM